MSDSTKKAATAPPSKTVQKKQIEEYLALRDKRLALNREAAATEALEEPLKAAILQFVRDHGGKERCVSRSGFVLAIKDRKAQPKWKDEFVRLAGNDEAEAIIKKAPLGETLSVEPVA